MHAIALARHAPERLLEMVARAAETVVNLHVAQCRVEVVAPQHRNGTAPDPDAFGAAGWAIKDAGRLSELVDPLALVLAGFGRRGRRLLALFGRFLLGLVLRKGRCRSNEQRGAE